MTTSRKGAFYAGLGLPGTGKSSTMRELGKLLSAEVLLEPEEDRWGQAVHERERCGYFSGLMWFRSTRVPLIYQADRIRSEGGYAVLDSYYDKVLKCYLGKQGMEWLLRADDPYFACAQEIARLDFEHLPDADCVILFELEEPIWRRLITARGRVLDQNESFLRSFETQHYFAAAAQELADKRSIRLIRFAQEFGSAQRSAEKLFELLQAHERTLS